MPKLIYDDFGFAYYDFYELARAYKGHRIDVEQQHRRGRLCYRISLRLSTAPEEIIAETIKSIVAAAKANGLNDKLPANHFRKNRIEAILAKRQAELETERKMKAYDESLKLRRAPRPVTPEEIQERRRKKIEAAKLQAAQAKAGAEAAAKPKPKPVAGKPPSLPPMPELYIHQGDLFND